MMHAAGLPGRGHSLKLAGHDVEHADADGGSQARAGCRSPCWQLAACGALSALPAAAPPATPKAPAQAAGAAADHAQAAAQYESAGRRQCRLQHRPMRCWPRRANGSPPAAAADAARVLARLSAIALTPAQATERSLLSAEASLETEHHPGRLAADRRAAGAGRGRRARSASTRSRCASRWPPRGRSTHPGRDGRRTLRRQCQRAHRAALAAAGRSARCARPRRQARSARPARIRWCAAGSSSAPSRPRRALPRSRRDAECGALARAAIPITRRRGAGAGVPERRCRPPALGARVALLLPLTGPAAAQALTVRDGFLSAYLSAAAGEPPGAAPLRHRQRCRARRPRAGARRRQQFHRRTADARGRRRGRRAGPAAVPVLALNFLPSDQPAPHGLYQFALSPEEEARLVAQRLLADGHHRGIALVPRGDWGSARERCLHARAHRRRRQLDRRWPATIRRDTITAIELQSSAAHRRQRGAPPAPAERARRQVQLRAAPAWRHRVRLHRRTERRPPRA